MHHSAACVSRYHASLWLGAALGRTGGAGGQREASPGRPKTQLPSTLMPDSASAPKLEGYLTGSNCLGQLLNMIMQ